MNFLSTVEQSPLSSLFPKGWNLERIEACCTLPPETLSQRQSFWHTRFEPHNCEDERAMDVMMGHEVAALIRRAYEEGKPIALLLSAGFKGMYRWLAYFLLEWHVGCAHVHTFALGEWSDKDGNEPEQGSEISLQSELVNSLFRPLGALAVPPGQRNYATQHNLPKYAQKLNDLVHGDVEIDARRDASTRTRVLEHSTHDAIDARALALDASDCVERVAVEH
jgi:glucosamine-6-phosphate deaminase